MAKRKKLVTPIGVARYPYLNKPDTKFDKQGVYRVELLFDPQEHEEFLNRLDKLANEAVEDAKEELKEKRPQDVEKVMKKEPYEKVYDEDGEPTGEVKVKFKMNHIIDTEDGQIELNPDLFDAKGNQVDQDQVSIRGGSELRINFTPRPYYMASTKQAGISNQLNAVQIIKLVESYGNADYYGFEEENDGFDATELEAESAADNGFDVNEHDSDDEDDDLGDVDF